MNKRIIFVVFLAVVAGLLLFSNGTPAIISGSQHEIRAAIDVGSGSTNLKVAEVDPATNKVIKIIFEDAVRVSYQNQLEKTSTGLFDKEIMDLGMKTMKDFKAKAIHHGATKVVAVATAAFRNAKNAHEFAEKIRQETGIEMYIIDQQMEGQLAFMAAVAKSDSDPGHIVVWDIGGGSFQLTAMDNHHQFIVSRGVFASEPFKKFIVTMIQGKDISKVSSPNPMSEENVKQALTKAEQVAQDTDPYIVKELEKGDVKVLAVGDLFNFGIRGVVDNKNVITADDLQNAVNEMQGKDDEKLGGVYVDVRVSNAILVLGFMKQLHIDQVQVLDVNNADGVLVSTLYW
jgi:exopolyphosphatase / guanosine-5'-triphosphate,3'-diphosphate pyrophosphatase